MGKRTLIKIIVAGILYTGAILFTYYIAMILFKGNSSLTFLGLVVCTVGVCIPTSLALILLISSVRGVKKI